MAVVEKGIPVLHVGNIAQGGGAPVLTVFGGIPTLHAGNVHPTAAAGAAATPGALSLSEEMPAGTWSKTSQCALVLEKSPVTERLYFESFPGHVDEQHTAEWAANGGTNLQQPSSYTYRGGNWGDFNLELQFRVGGSGSNPDVSGADQLEQMLLAMERKVRWCQALTFPFDGSGGISAAVETTEPPRRSKEIYYSKLVQGIQNAFNGASDYVPVTPPSVVLIQFGSWMTLRAYCGMVAIKWGPPWHPISVRPYAATVTMMFKLVKPKLPTWKSIRNQGSPIISVSGGIPTLSVGNIAQRR